MTTRKSNSIRPSLQHLEDRTVMSGVTASMSQGVLTIIGTPYADTITVHQHDSHIAVEGVNKSFDVSKIRNVRIGGRGGDDLIDVREVLKPVMVAGGTGSDLLIAEGNSSFKFIDYRSADSIEVTSDRAVGQPIIRSDGTVYSLESNGLLYRNGTVFGEDCAQFAVDAQGAVLSLSTDQSLWVRQTSRSSTGRWIQVRAAVQLFALTSDGTAIVQEGRWLWIHVAKTKWSQWQVVATEVEAVSINSDDVVNIRTSTDRRTHAPGANWNQWTILDTVEAVYAGVDDQGRTAEIRVYNSGEVLATNASGSVALGRCGALLNGAVKQWFVGLDSRGSTVNRVVINNGSAYAFMDGSWQQTDSQGVERFYAGVDSEGREATIRVLNSGDVYATNSQGDRLLGTTKSLALVGTGIVRSMGIGADGNFYYLLNSGVLGMSGHGQLTSGVRSMAFASDGKVYYLTDNGSLMEMGYGRQSTDVMALAADADGKIYYLVTNGGLMEMGYGYRAFQILALVADAAGKVYILADDSSLIEMGHGTRSTGAAALVADARGTVYYLEANGSLMEMGYGTRSTEVTALVSDFSGKIYSLTKNGSLMEIGYGSRTTDVLALATDANGKVLYLDANGSLMEMGFGARATSVKALATDGVGRAYYLLGNGNLMGLNQEVLATNVKCLFNCRLGRIFSLTHDGKLNQLGSEARTIGTGYFAMDKASRIWWLSENGTLRRLEANGHWTQVASGVGAFGVDSAGNAFRMTADSTIEIWDDGVSPSWRAIAWGIRSFGVDHSGRVWGLSIDGVLKVRGGPGNSTYWFTVAAGVRAFVVDHAGLAWQHGSDLKLSRWVNNSWLVIDDLTISHCEFTSRGIVVQDQNRRLLLISDDGSLARTVLADQVISFSLTSQELRIDRGNGVIDTFLWNGDVQQFMSRAIASGSKGIGSTDSAGRGVVGNLSTVGDLMSQYGSTSAPSDILGSVVRINCPADTFGSLPTFGSGTLLAGGGNVWVLTAAHVVEDSHGQEFSPGTMTATFIIRTANGGQTTQTRAVSQVIGRAYFNGRDVALVRLSQSVAGVQGAYLPSGDLWNNLPVLIAGFGDTNDGSSGTLKFGYGTYENVGVNEDVDYYPGTSRPMLGVGLHLINEFSEGEAASAPGDSGGPDFRIKLKSVDGKLAWLPEVVGVHSYGTGPKGHITVPGDRTASVQVTSELAALIRQLADITSQPIVYEEMIDLAPVSFRPPHTNGDQEFKGHGPNVNVSAQFFFRGDDLCLRIYMKARETVSDWTTAEGTLEYTMVRGFRRQFQIADGQTLSQAWNYTDNDEEDDASPVFSEGSVIGQFVCVGDTHGYDAGITTKVTVYFRPLRANRVVEA